ncbi:MAG: ribosomal-processing cysteine protease Prp [Clostridiaceae bacterium]|nr:ribosomal-processing cysteine protease Prp [Clostridiaceae bacterium]MDD6275139.1 ribosomal-processing cysteine protease Prp [Clostridiaceae bacterium]
MTVVTFFRKDGAYLGFQAGGHSGHAPRGADIVCAAISAAVGLAECEITDVLKLPAEVVVDDENTEVSVRFQEPCEAAQPVFRALCLYLTRLAGEYPRFLKIMEV